MNNLDGVKFLALFSTVVTRKATLCTGCKVTTYSWGDATWPQNSALSSAIHQYVQYVCSRVVKARWLPAAGLSDGQLSIPQKNMRISFSNLNWFIVCSSCHHAGWEVWICCFLFSDRQHVSSISVHCEASDEKVIASELHGLTKQTGPCKFNY